LQPKAYEPHLRIAEIHLSQQRLAQANEAVGRARAIAPQALPVLRMAAGLAARGGKFDAALATAREAQAAHAQDAAGFLIEGEIHAMRGDRAASERVLRVASGKRGADEAVRRLHGLLVTEGRAADAARVASDWQARHPTDIGFLQHLASRALERKDYGAAEDHFRQVVRQQPRNAEALNNIAWLMMQQRKAGALAYAERATQASPNNAALMDTLAMSYAAAGQFDKAIRVQQQVLQLVPDSGTFGLNLARIYVMAGDKPSARRALEPLVDKKFAGQAEAKQLLSSIAKGG
jgi:cellulose synthase operon protein C